MKPEFDYRACAFLNYGAQHELLRRMVEAREFRGLTQQDLADAMNVESEVVKRIENGSQDYEYYVYVEYMIEVGLVLNPITTLASCNMTAP